MDEEEFGSNPRSTSESIEILVNSYRSSMISQQAKLQIAEIRELVSRH